MRMADNIGNLLVLSVLRIVLELVIDFFCSDTSIRYPCSPNDTVSISALLCNVTSPFLIIITDWMFTRPTGSHTTFHRPHLIGLVGGALLTAFLTGRLAPNFYEGCNTDVKTCWIGQYLMTHPERLREVSWLFPCMSTSLSFFNWVYLLLFCVHTSSAPSLTRKVLVVTSLTPPTIIAFTRFHDNKSLSGDVIAGGILGVFIAVSAIRLTTFSIRVLDRIITQSRRLKPTVRVCSSALLSNIDGFIGDLKKRSHGFVDRVLHEQLPYNDLDAFTPNGWDKSDVIILCHSIDNRRLSLTDVMDALYDKFIPKVSKLCGKNSLIVIVHDFKWTRDPTKSRKDIEDTLRAKQPTVYKHAGHVILAGKLGKKSSDGLLNQDWDVIDDVISDWSKRRP